MKQGKFILALLILFACLYLPSCTNSDERTNNQDAETVDSTYSDTTVSYFEKPDSTFEVLGVDSNLLWTVDVEHKTLKKPKSSLPPALNTVIGSLNAQYPEIQLTNPKLNHDTLALQIPNSNYFTNQMGSSGASQYLAQAIINLTSVPGIKYVKLDFEMGSHAAPGIWSKKDFQGYIVVQ